MPNATAPKSSGLLFDATSSLAVRPRDGGGQPRRPHGHEWDAYVHDHPDGTIFHTQAWREAVESVFGHQPVYLSAYRGTRLIGVLPMFFVDSRFVGRVLISVPYAVGGGILADDAPTTQALFESARQAALCRACRGIDFRSERAVIDELPVVGRHVGFKRALPDRVEDVLVSLPRKARAAARNARRKFGLSISYSDQFLPQVWKLYTRSMRRLASPNYPYAFFKQLVDATPGAHWVALVRHEGEPIAGLVTFLYRDTVLPYFVGLSDEAKHYGAANFLYLCTMERAVAKGYRYFDFGRSRKDNQGSYDFKRFQGFEPHPLGYQFYTAPGQRSPALSPTDARWSIARRIWPRLPLCVTRPLGARLSRHFPG
ncbi:MAG: FemAB family XrtA/PEP-CTERM system-associated protein [Phycisphaerae bacterium]